MLPMLLGALATGGMMGLGAIQGMAPSAGGAIDTVLTPHMTCAKQREYMESPTLELPPDCLTDAKHKGVISEDRYHEGLARNGINNNRGNIILEQTKPLISMSELSNNYYKGDISQNDYFKKAKRLGYDRTEASLYLTGSRNTPDVDSLITNLWRGHIDKPTYLKKMLALGYNTTDATVLYNSQLFLPSHEDLIRFQVRDVYNDNIVAKYGYDEEFPSTIVPDAQKIGMTEEQLRKYWKAHWELPSPTSVYIMHQRLDKDILSRRKEKYEQLGLDSSKLETTTETMSELLKINDYPKYWRDRMIAISYDPITRVDLRRIYTLGLCDDQFVVDTLREHGYTQKDAELMLNFYKSVKQGTDKQLSEAQLIKALDYGRITKEEFKTRLKELNWTDEDIALKLQVHEDSLYQKDFNDIIKLLQTQYALGNIDEDKIRSVLAEHNVTARKTDLIIDKFKDARYKKQKVPPIKDLNTFFQSGIMTEETYLEGLKANGILATYRQYYVDTYKPKSKSS